ATNLLIQLFNRQMPLNINLFPSHKLNYNDHSIKTFAQHYNLNCSGFFLIIFFFPGKYNVLREFVVF
ncbi:MAG: hypothetical protein PQ971_01225, partial [Methanobacterium sp.]